MFLQGIRRHATYANVCATLALFVALSGGIAWAATELRPKSVKSKHIAPRAVRAIHIAPGVIGSAQIRNGSVVAADLAPALRNGLNRVGPPGPAGPAAATAPPGPAGVPGRDGADPDFAGRRMGAAIRQLAAAANEGVAPEIPLGSVDGVEMFVRCFRTLGVPDDTHLTLNARAGAGRAGTLVADTDAGFVILAPGPARRELIELATDDTTAARLVSSRLTLRLPGGTARDLRLFIHVQRTPNLPSTQLFPAGHSCGVGDLGDELVGG